MSKPVQKYINIHSNPSLLRDAAIASLTIIYALLKIQRETALTQLEELPLILGIISGIATIYILRFSKLSTEYVKRVDEYNRAILIAIMVVGGLLFGSGLVWFSVPTLQAVTWLLGFSSTFLFISIIAYIISEYYT